MIVSSETHTHCSVKIKMSRWTPEKWHGAVLLIKARCFTFKMWFCSVATQRQVWDWPDKSVLVCILYTVCYVPQHFQFCIWLVEGESTEYPDSGPGRVMTVHHNTGHWRDENTECGDSDTQGWSNTVTTSPKITRDSIIFNSIIFNFRKSEKFVYDP